MATSTGFQRVVQLFWDKDLENTDNLNPIIVLGKSYVTHLHSNHSTAAAAANSKDINQPKEKPEQIQEQQQSPPETFHDLRQYFARLKIPTQSTSLISSTSWPSDFIKDIYTRIWFTYRTRFPPIASDTDGPSPITLQNIIFRGQTADLNADQFTTDCGWGCMIRTGQTLLANTLLNLKCGREYQYIPGEVNIEHDNIVKMFVDDPGYPFSIHNIVEKGKLLSGKKVGEWFGPSATARSLRALCGENKEMVGLNVYIGSDSGDIYEKDVFKIACEDDDEEEGVFSPVLILLGVRLGVENINSVYWSSLQDLLNMPHSVGISGGRPSSSHYFFGYQGDYLFYLDPHVAQPALKVNNEKDGNLFDFETVHTKKIRKIHISEIDPSMLIGLLIKDEEQWWDFKKRIQKGGDKNKIIHISPDESPDVYCSARRPSFVVIDNDSDDFIDVGLEYGEINEQEEEEEEEREEEEEKEEAEKEEEEPVVVVVTGTKEAVDGMMNVNKSSDSITVVENEELQVITAGDAKTEEIDSSGDRSSIVLIEKTTTVSEEEFTKSSEISPSPEFLQQLEFSETSGSFENFTNSIKDDYENIEAGLVDTLQEEICCVEKEDITLEKDE